MVKIRFEIAEILKQAINIKIVLRHNFTNIPINSRHLLNCVKEIEGMGSNAEVHWPANYRGEIYSLKFD